MNWFTYFIIGAVISALAGYIYGKKLLERAHIARKNVMVSSHNDSKKNAKAIADVIKERAFVLGNRNLTYDIKDLKNRYVKCHLFDYDRKLGNDGLHTKAFLKGDSIRLIKFIRWCHFYGCSIVLRQIGEKPDVTEGKGEVIYLSMPDIELYK